MAAPSTIVSGRMRRIDHRVRSLEVRCMELVATVIVGVGCRVQERRSYSARGESVGQGGNKELLA